MPIDEKALEAAALAICAEWTYYPATKQEWNNLLRLGIEAYEAAKPKPPAEPSAGDANHRAFEIKWFNVRAELDGMPLFKVIEPKLKAMCLDVWEAAIATRFYKCHPMDEKE